MTLRVSGKNMDVGDALRSKAQDHFDAVVEKYFDGGYTGHLTLEPEGSGFSAICLVHLDSGAILQSSAFGNDAIAAYERMAETIEKRLRRYNRKLKQHRRHGNDEEVPAAAPDGSGAIAALEEESEVLSAPVIAESAEVMRQMSVEQAVMELDITQADVVMFRRAGHSGLNVVYRRADGNIGWIDPALSAD